MMTFVCGASKSEASQPYDWLSPIAPENKYNSMQLKFFIRYFGRYNSNSSGDSNGPIRKHSSFLGDEIDLRIITCDPVILSADTLQFTIREYGKRVVCMLSHTLRLQRHQFSFFYFWILRSHFNRCSINFQFFFQTQVYQEFLLFLNFLRI